MSSAAFTLASIRHWLSGISADEVSAAAAMGTLAIALGATIVAWRQLREARTLRVAAAAPYVVVYIEPHPEADWTVQLVAKNFGATAATDVELSIDPPAVMWSRSGGTNDPIHFPSTIPLLAPGQALTTVWDSAIERRNSGLPQRHEATVRFTDSLGARSEKMTYVLDWALIYDRLTLSRRGVHHLAEAVEKIEKTIMRWSPSASSGLTVWTRDGEARAEREQQRYKELRQLNKEEAASRATGDCEDTHHGGNEKAAD
jgi:hypothetical protein